MDYCGRLYIFYRQLGDSQKVEITIHGQAIRAILAVRSYFWNRFPLSHRQWEGDAQKMNKKPGLEAIRDQHPGKN